MKALRFRPAARRDLDGIWNYTAERWGTEQAETYLRAIQAACQRLCNGSSASQSADHILKGVRKTSVGSHCIYLRETKAEITVIRILHYRMDVSRHF